MFNSTQGNVYRCAMLRRDRSDAAVADRLGNIEESINTLSGRLRGGRKSDTESLNGLRSFLQAASAFHSNASEFSSSGSTVTGDKATERGGSAFGAPLSKDRSTRIEDWIAPQPDDKLHDDTTEDAPSFSGFNKSFHKVESLPQLLSVLENAAQMANRFQAGEKKRTLTKNEEIRSLQERCSTYETTLADFKMKLEVASQDQVRAAALFRETQEQEIEKERSMWETAIQHHVRILKATHREEIKKMKEDIERRLDDSDRELDQQRNLRKSLERRLEQRDRELDLHVKTNIVLSIKIKALQAESSITEKRLSERSTSLEKFRFQNASLTELYREVGDMNKSLLAAKAL